MKHLLLAACALALILTGCSTPRTVSNLEGRGTKHVFNSPYDSVWRAAVDAAQQDDLQVLNADRSRGYISARRTVRVETFGENVGVWVRGLSPSSTEVEVVSRQAGPPVLWMKNWENEIIRAIAANLTREVPAVGATGSESYIYREPVVVVPETRRETIIVPEARRETELRLEELREEQRQREAELRREQDQRRRDEIRAEIDRLRDELRLQEQRLNDLEEEVR